jgi:hypothetical protein
MSRDDMLGQGLRQTCKPYQTWGVGNMESMLRLADDIVLRNSYLAAVNSLAVT